MGHVPGLLEVVEDRRCLEPGGGVGALQEQQLVGTPVHKAVEQQPNYTDVGHCYNDTKEKSRQITAPPLDKC